MKKHIPICAVLLVVASLTFAQKNTTRIELSTDEVVPEPFSKYKIKDGEIRMDIPAASIVVLEVTPKPAD